MAISHRDITMVLSGGSDNLDPDKSIGGNPSAQPITGVLNNLFADVDTSGSAAGLEDYRCFYVFNDNANETFYDVKLAVTSKVIGGSRIQIGVRFANETQVVSIKGSPNGGSAVLLYETHQVMFGGNPDPGVMASNLATALNATAVVGGVTVVGAAKTDTTAGQSVNLTVFFQGASGNRSHDLMTVQSNSLTNSGAMSVTRLSGGGPVNSIADDLDVDITPPAGVIFVPTDVTPILLGEFRPNDGAPVWVKRTVAVGTPSKQMDGFTLTVTGVPFL